MKLDTKKLKKIIENMGYSPEFNSNTPGISVDGVHINWNNVKTVIDFDKKGLSESTSKPVFVDDVLHYFKTYSNEQDSVSVYCTNELAYDELNHDVFYEGLVA